MSININPREMRILTESGMPWETAKKMAKMVKTVFKDSEIISITKTEPAKPQTSAYRTFPVKYGEDVGSYYLNATKGGAPLKKKSKQNQTSLPFD